MRNIDMKNNRFTALEAPYVTGAGMNTSASLLNNFRVSFNQINVRLRSPRHCMGVRQRWACCCGLLWLIFLLAWGASLEGLLVVTCRLMPADSKRISWVQCRHLKACLPGKSLH